jgi:hypothetical protein
VIIGGIDNDVTSQGCGIMTSQHGKCTEAYGAVISGNYTRVDGPSAIGIGGYLVTLEGVSAISLGGTETRVGGPNTMVISGTKNSDIADGKVHILNAYTSSEGPF